MPDTLWTVGHSNRSIRAFIDLLTAESIAVLADVRRLPASRTNPQFNRESLCQSLAEAGIEYRHFPEMGGRRKERLPDSPNTAWRVEAFNAYADHLQSDEFQGAWAELIVLAQKSRTAVMCAEALPWRCHRRLIADAAIARGWTVRDIVGPNQVKPHELPPFAQVAGQEVIYPGETLF